MLRFSGAGLNVLRSGDVRLRDRGLRGLVGTCRKGKNRKKVELYKGSFAKVLPDK